MFFKPKGPYCQSCGMPLSKDRLGGGTELDGNKSKDYCSHCYECGEFTDPGITLDQMKKKVKDKLSSMYIPSFLGDYFTKDMSTLKRWAGKSHCSCKHN